MGQGCPSAERSAGAESHHSPRPAVGGPAIRLRAWDRRADLPDRIKSLYACGWPLLARQPGGRTNGRRGLRTRPRSHDFGAYREP
jgi:hypothetical protein